MKQEINPKVKDIVQLQCDGKCVYAWIKELLPNNRVKVENLMNGVESELDISCITHVSGRML